MNIIYTKTGDKGETSLYDGTRVHKDSLRVEAYGTIDELSSHIGFAARFVEEEDVIDKLTRIQKKLFFVAGELATLETQEFEHKITEKEIKALENWIDHYIEKINRVDAFILPGTNKAAGALHIARTVCRRGERAMLALSRQEPVSADLIKFINRLSDVLYTFARYLESEIVLIDFDEMGREEL